MSQRQAKASYWQDAPMPREQLVLFAETLDQRIPEDHPVRMLDEILERVDWNEWEGGYAPNYTPMAVTETESGFIVGADVLIGNVEHTVMMAMIDMIVADYDQTPETMMGDGAYCTGPNLAESEERGIELLSPIPEEKPDNPAIREDLTQPVADQDLDRLPLNPQTKKFDKLAFVYDAEHDCYCCAASGAFSRNGSGAARPLI